MPSRHNLNRIAFLVAVVEEGSVTAAAARLGVSKAVVSKQLQLLEEEVGVSLVQRNTRRLRPTEAGLSFYTDSKAALLQANAAFDAARNADGVPRGRLRLTAPVDYGLLHVAPLVSRFRATYPEVQVEVTLSDARFDLIEHRFDIAFRVGWLEDSTNRARKLRDFEEIVVCHPELASTYTLEDPRDLVPLPFIANQVLPRPNHCTFRRGRQRRKLELSIAMSMNVSAAIRQALLAAPSFSILPDFLLGDDVERGRLVRLFPDWSLRTGGVFVVQPPSKLRGSAVRAFLDMCYLA